MAEHNTTAPKPRPRQYGGTGHLPAKQRALERERRAKNREQAAAMSDDSGTAQPKWAAELLAKLDELVAALKRK